MTYRSSRFSKLKQALTQTPATNPTPPQPWSPVPLDGDPRRPVRNFADPRQLPGLERMTASDGLTVLMPAVQAAPIADSTPTQILPPVAEDLPPSAQHADPARRTTTFVEDNDLEPQTRGRHVLAELKDDPETTAVLVAVQQRAHTVLDAYDPWRQVVAAARANDERMRAFAAKSDAWQNRFEREFETWSAGFKKSLAATRANWAETSGRTNAARLEMDYRDGGTSAALYTTQQLAEEIARHEAAGSAVAA